MTDDGVAGFSMAQLAAERLRRIHPNHELLRLITNGTDEVSLRRDQERIERFWDAKQYGDPDHAPAAKLDAITFCLLAKAMDRVIDGPTVPTIKIERLKLSLNPSIEIFNVTLEHKDPSRIWKHTAGDESGLHTFLGGVEAAVHCMGGFISLPETPSHAAKPCVDDSIDDDIPF